MLILTTFLISGCSTVQKLDVFSTEVERVPLNLESPVTPEMEEIKWVIITSENAEQVFAKLKEQGIDKNDLTREEFLNHAWEWTHEYGGVILEQLKKLGASCDWNRTRFTMEQDFYKGRLAEKYGLSVVVPNSEDRDVVHQVIYNELCLGKIIPDSKCAYLSIIEKLADELIRSHG